MEFPLSGVGVSNIVTTIIVIFCFLHVCEGAVIDDKDGCLPNAIYVDENARCSGIYYRCEGSVWMKASCAVGIFNKTAKECVPFSNKCVNIGPPPQKSFVDRQGDCSYISDICTSPSYRSWDEHNCPKYCGFCSTEDRGFSKVRVKRQSTTKQDACADQFICPADLTHEFVYPDWANKDCDTFFECANGVLTKKSCKQGQFNYYNPRTLSCEEKPSKTNTCIHREFTDLSPI